MKTIKEKIRTIPHFPKKGIMYRDITTLLKDPSGLKKTIDLLAKRYRNKKIDFVAGIESRGFIIGSSLAFALNKGFIPIRKKGKLPAKTISQKYTLEYGFDEIEMHTDALKKGARVLLVDDLIATGGTLEAAIKLIKKAGGEIFESACVIELIDLQGKKRLLKENVNLFSLVGFFGD